MAVLAWIGFTVLPGLALLRLLRVPISLLGAAVIAAPVSFGTVYLVALVATRFYVSVNLGCLVVVGVVILGWVYAEVSRRRRCAPVAADRGQNDGRVRNPGIRARFRSEFTVEQLVGAALLVAAVALGLILWFGLHSALTVPAGWDAMHHGYFVRQIVDHDTMDPAVVLSSGPGTADGTTGFYPLAFNLAAALLHEFFGVPISVLLLASTPAIAGVLLPCSTFYLVRTLAKQPVTAGFAAVATVLPINLYTVEYTGRITAVLGLAIVPAACALLLQAGARPTYRYWLISAVTAIGVTGMHTSETPLLFAMVAILALATTLISKEWKSLARFLVSLLGASLSAAAVLILVEPGVLDLVGERSGALGPGGGHQSMFRAVRGLLTQPQFGHQGMLLFASAALLGSVLTAHPHFRRLRGTALCYLGFAAFYLAWVTDSLGPLSFLGIPWYQDSARMLWVLSLLGAIPAGVTLAALTVGIRWTITAIYARNGPPQRWVTRSARITAPSLLLLVVLVLGTPAVRAESSELLKPASPVTPDYQAAFGYLAAHQQPAGRVLDDLRNHGDLWMFVDDDVPTLLGNAPLIGLAPDSWKERLYLRGNLADIGTDPCIGQLLTKYHVSYVFYGDQVVTGGTPMIELATLQNTEYFSPVFARGGAHVFQVLQPQASGRCVRHLTTEFPWDSITDAH